MNKKHLLALLALVCVLCCAFAFVACDPDVGDVESVALNTTTLTLSIGQEAALRVTVNPSGAEKNVSWSSNNTSVARVDDGRVVAHSEGVATITASVGGKTAECVVTVIGEGGGSTVTEKQWSEIFGSASNYTYLKRFSGVTVENRIDGSKWYKSYSTGEGDQIVVKEGTTFDVYTNNSYRGWVKSTLSEEEADEDIVAEYRFAQSIVKAFQNDYSRFTYSEGEYTAASIDKNETFGGTVTNVRLAFQDSNISWMTFEVDGDSYSIQSFGWTEVSVPTNFIDGDRAECPIYDGQSLYVPVGTSVAEMYEEYDDLTTENGKWELYMWQNESWVKLEDSDTVPAEGDFRCKLVFNGTAKGEDVEFTLVGDHKFKFVYATDPSCTEDGAQQHYACETCEKLFWSENRNDEISDPSAVVRGKYGHYTMQYYAREASCTWDGWLEHYRCQRCEKMFEDPEGTKELDKATVILPKLGHDIKLVPAKESTCTKKGNTEYYLCSNCNEMFEDGEGETEIEDKTSVVIAKKPHSFNEGFCAVCHRQEPTAGVEYFTNGDEAYVNSIGSATETEIILAEDYEGLPVTSIEGSAFSNASITSITIPESIVDISWNAFGGCTSLTTVKFLGTMEEWLKIYFHNTRNSNPLNNGANLYVDGELVTELEIPSTITRIEDYAFYGCESLTSVTIPASVTDIGSGAFHNCDNLTTVRYAGDMKGWFELYGVHNIMDNPCTLYVNDVEFKGEITIPDTITSIKDFAFCNCVGVTSLVIPASVTRIGSGAFNYCDNLTTVRYTGDMAGWCALQGITNIMDTPRTVYVNGVELAGEVTIPDSVTKIGEYAFYNNTSITSVVIPNSVTEIEGSAFSRCSNLASVTLGSGVTKISYSAFGECSALETVRYGGNEEGWLNIEFSSIYSNPLAGGATLYIGSNAVTELEIPNSVTEIKQNAFYGYAQLTSVTMGSGVAEIGNQAFYNCVNLASVTMGSGVKTIEGSAFSGCESLTSVTIPEGVTTIGSRAFYNCVNLASVTLGSGVETIGNSAFAKCESLTSVTIPNSLTVIADYAFSDCSSLTSVTIGSEVTKIGFGAFSGCVSLTSVTIPANVTVISESAFSDCYELESVTIGSGVTSIGKEAFYGCISLASVTIPEGVTTIGDRAFQGADITSLVIPNSVTEIGNNAFSDCLSLETLTIGSGVKKTGSNVFGGDKAIKRVDFAGDVAGWCELTDVGALLSETCNLYIGGEEIQGNVVIPDGTTSIGAYAFQYCDKITSVTIPDSVTSIGDYAFQYCNNITSLTIGNGVTIIGAYAFQFCDKFASVAVPDSVTGIGEYAFRNCTALTTATLGNSVTKISYAAFWGCQSLRSINIPASVTTFEYEQPVGKNPFGLCNGLTISCEVAEQPSSWGNGWNTTFHLNNFEYATKLPVIWNCKNNNTDSDGYMYVYYDGIRYKVKDNVAVVVTQPETMTKKNVSIPVGINIDNHTYYVKEIAPYAFSSCGITDITIATGVEKIGRYAFGNCTSLRAIGVALSNDKCLPSTVTTVENGAFRNCTSLTEITIPSNVTTMGDRVFEDCAGIVVRCEATEKPEGWQSTWNNRSYTSSTYPTVWGWDTNKTATDGYVYFTDGGLSYKAKDGEATVIEQPSSLTEAHIPATVTSGATYLVTAIDMEAFQNCSKLTSVTIGSNVTTIGRSAFSGCTSLASITINSNNVVIASNVFNDTEYFNDESKWDGGALYIGNCLIAVRPTVSGSFTVKEETKNIAENAFYRCKLLTSVTIPSGVTTIAKEAFYGCTSTVIYCEASSAPTGWNGSWNSIETVGDSKCPVVWNCKFSDTDAEGFAYAIIDGIRYSLKDGKATVIQQLEDITVADIPATVEHKGNTYNVTTIGAYAFYYCQKLTSVTIPSGVTSIGHRAFYSCDKLTSVTIPETVTEIGIYAFYHCEKLTSVVIPEGVTKIENTTFYYCFALASVTIPNGVTEIGSSAFEGCRSLTSITIPNSVTKIQGAAFSGCVRLSKVYYTGSIAEWCSIEFVYDNSNPLKNEATLYINEQPVTELVIPGTVTTIGNHAFTEANITSVTISEGVTEIGFGAFANCRRLASVTIPSSVTKIVSSAFAGCLSLTSITIPETVTEMGSSAFTDCTTLTIYCEAETKPEGWESSWNGNSTSNVYCPVVWNCKSNKADADGNEYEVIDGIRYLLKDGEATVIQQPAALSVVVIPETVTSVDGTEYAVTKIASNAFYYYTVLSITIPASVTTIEADAFSYCNDAIIYCKVAEKPEGWAEFSRSLFDVVWDCDHNEVSEKGNIYVELEGIRYSLTYDEATIALVLIDVESMVIPDKISYKGKEYVVVTIGSSAFKKCSQTKDVTIPASIKRINYQAFGSCVLENVYYLGDVAGWCNIYIYNEDASPLKNGANLYVGGELVTELVIPQTVKRINSAAFYGCGSLTKVTLGTKVTEIGSYAFGKCANLESIVIPKGVASIDRYAFVGCYSLTISCEAKRQPRGWSSDWNSRDSYVGNPCPVIWDCKNV